MKAKYRYTEYYNIQNFRVSKPYKTSRQFVSSYKEYTNRMIQSRDSRKSEGPVFNEDNIPYDYIIIIDSGSKGSRAYIYNSLSSQYLVDNDIPISKILQTPLLVKRIAHGDDEDEDGDEDTDSDDDNDDDTDNHIEDSEHHASFLHPLLDEIEHKELLPKIQTRPAWKKKINPGISSFKDSPHNVGKKHIKPLLKAVSKIIPKEQQYRTPIFLHATGGMRLLKPSEQEEILSTACEYIKEKSSFYLPDCESHINVIDGEIEGLYGWIALNYLVGAFDNPDDHHHGKNHHTYGLLDMGGASTQIAFQPNETEIEQQKNTLYTVNLASFGSNSVDLSYDVFSTSFLGLGMYQSYSKYLDILISLSEVEMNTIKDPCLPKGFTKKITSRKPALIVEGNGDFNSCLNDIYPLIVGPSTEGDTSCDLTNPQDVSACLLSDALPSMDFDIDRFIGVSGYWDSIGNLLNLKDSHDTNADLSEKYENAYMYESFYNRTAEICNIPWSDLQKLNNKKQLTGSDDENYRLIDLSNDELSELCYKSSWILNVLHRGLGFPRYGIDTEEDHDHEMKSSIHVAEKINGSDFSWTLGRAILYSSAESAEAMANKTQGSLPVKVGFIHGAATDTLFYGAEVEGINFRPRFVDENTYKDYKSNDVNESSHWRRLHEHRLAGSFVFLILILGIGFLLIGKKRRNMFFVSLRSKLIGTKSIPYNKIANDDIELGNLDSETPNFEIDDNDD